jgi:hypothetical protein
MTHHHRSGEAHPSPEPALSLLRLSAALRMAVATGLIAAIWALTVWAMNLSTG